MASAMLLPKEQKKAKDVTYKTYAEKVQEQKEKEKRKEEKAFLREYSGQLLYGKPCIEKKEVKYSSISIKKPIQGKSSSNKQLGKKNLALAKPRKTIKKKHYVPSYPYASIFTDNMHVCYITGRTDNVDPHHIFGHANKVLSEKYHFMLPLVREWHTLASYSIHQDNNLSLKYKRLCQDYYINVLGKTKEDWIDEFKKWW